MITGAYPQLTSLHFLELLLQLVHLLLVPLAEGLEPLRLNRLQRTQFSLMLFLLLSQGVPEFLVCEYVCACVINKQNKKAKAFPGTTVTLICSLRFTLSSSE